MACRLALRGFCCMTALVALAGCAAYRAPAAPGLETEPRAAWSIRSGGYGSERDICRSDANLPCVLQASSAGEPVSVVVAVYLYPTEAPTTYQGAFMSGFIPGPTPNGYESKVDYKIDPGRRPNSVSVTGQVVDRPGEYAFQIALLAEVPGHVDPHQFQERFAVRVVPATASGE